MGPEPEGCPPSGRRKVVRLREETHVDQVVHAWTRVLRFEREVSQALRAHGLSFALFRVLEATDRSVRAIGGAVSQQDVVRASRLRRSSVGSLMRRLESRGLVDIGLAQRILLTAAGEASLAGARSAILRAAYDAGLHPQQI